MEDKRTWGSVNFLIGFGLIPSSSHSPAKQCRGQKKTLISTHLLKIQLCSGGRRGVATFTNITEKVPALLISIVDATDWHDWMSNIDFKVDVKRLPIFRPV